MDIGRNWESKIWDLIASTAFDWIRSDLVGAWKGTNLHMTILDIIKAMKLVSEGFGSEAEFRESCLTLLDLVCFQFGLSRLLIVDCETSAVRAAAEIS